MTKKQILSRRNFFKQLLGIGLLPSCGVLATLQQALAENEPKVRHGIIAFDGIVTVDDQPAKLGMLIQAGQTVHTAAQAKVVYVIGNNAFLQRENSNVKFALTALTDFMHVLNGRILSVFGSGNKQLHTATATIGIRGTACHLAVDEDKTYLCLCYGTIEVQLNDATSPAFTLNASHHDRPLYLRNHGDSRVETAAMLDHHDDELQLLAALVGRIPPFAK